MNTRSLTESLYNKYGKYDLSNVDIKSNKNKLKSKKLHEDFDFEDDENKKLYNYFITTAEKHDFEVTSSGANYINFETLYDDYTLEIYVDVEDSSDDPEITFESVVYLPSGYIYGSEDNFDNLEAAIAWGEKIISPRMLLLRRIKNLINKSGVKDITLGELESLTYYLNESINIKKSHPRKKVLDEEWLAEDSFNVQDFISGFVGSTKFKIRDAEDNVFACSGDILDGKIVNIRDLVIDKNKISSLIITSFTIDPRDGTLVLYSYIPDDVWAE